MKKKSNKKKCRVYGTSSMITLNIINECKTHLWWLLKQTWLKNGHWSSENFTNDIFKKFMVLELKQVTYLEKNHNIVWDL